MSFGVNLMRSQVLHPAVQGVGRLHVSDIQVSCAQQHGTATPQNHYQALCIVGQLLVHAYCSTAVA